MGNDGDGHRPFGAPGDRALGRLTQRLRDKVLRSAASSHEARSRVAADRRVTGEVERQHGLARTGVTCQDPRLTSAQPSVEPVEFGQPRRDVRRAGDALGAACATDSSRGWSTSLRCTDRITVSSPSSAIATSYRCPPTSRPPLACGRRGTANKAPQVVKACSGRGSSLKISRATWRLRQRMTKSGIARTSLYRHLPRPPEQLTAPPR